MTPADHRRQAASIATYLAQFERTDQPGTTDSNDRPGYAELPDADRDRRHQDYLLAMELAQAKALTDEDVHALDQLRRRYGFQ